MLVQATLKQKESAGLFQTEDQLKITSQSCSQILEDPFLMQWYRGKFKSNKAMIFVMYVDFLCSIYVTTYVLIFLFIGSYYVFRFFVRFSGFYVSGHVFSPVT